ncbi:MAG: hypothetical protein GXO97_05335 [Nitrospirae bacterium]|nr:hypothetical protein [Nitrospirota bacterium]
MVHHPIDAIGFNYKRHSIFSLKMIHKVVGVSHCRYCYTGLLHHLFTSAKEHLCLTLPCN